MKTNKYDLEYRTMKVNAVEEKDDQGNLSTRMILEGYAVLFDQPQTYQFGDTTYTEQISRNALDNADMRKTVMRYNHHDSVFAMARTKNNSLVLTIDDIGLKIWADLIDTQSNRDLYRMIQNGLVDEMSFAFSVTPGSDIWTYEDDYDKVTRTITSIDVLYDVAAVDNGFYEKTSLYARTIEKLDDVKREWEERKLELEKEKAIILASL